MTNIYSMKLNESVFISSEKNESIMTTVIRVPGGWIYRSHDKIHNTVGSVFVPFHNEFENFYKFELDNK